MPANHDTRAIAIARQHQLLPPLPRLELSSQRSYQRSYPGDVEALGASAHELEDREEGVPPPIEVVC